MFNKKLIPLRTAESKFGYQLCEAHSIFSENMQSAIQNNDDSVKSEFIKHYTSILIAAKNYINQLIEDQDLVSSKFTKCDIASIKDKLEELYKSASSDVDVKTLYLNLTIAVKDVVSVISNDTANISKSLLLSYRKNRQKTYKKLNWSNLIKGTYSLRCVALEESFLGLMCYFQGVFDRKDLKEYERWHGFSKGGKITKGEVFRLVDSMSRQWEKVKFFRF